jgi:hypothetical protein
MDSITRTCNTFLEYPKNLQHCQLSSYSLRSYHERLNDQNKLLLTEQKASVNFRDRRTGEQGTSA